VFNVTSNWHAIFRHAVHNTHQFTFLSPVLHQLSHCSLYNVTLHPRTWKRQFENEKELTQKRTNRQMEEHRRLKWDSFYEAWKSPLTAMIQSGKCSFKIHGMILLQIFLQNCSVMGGVILDQLLAYFSDTVIVWIFHWTPSALRSCFVDPLRCPQVFVPFSWTVILEEAKTHWEKLLWIWG